MLNYHNWRGGGAEINPLAQNPDNQPARSKLKAAGLSIISNTSLMIVKLIIGLLMNSLAVISEAIHSGIDLLAALIAYFAIRKASQPADDQHPYGHGKLENISGVIEALLIFVISFYIIYEAVKRLLEGKAVEMLGWGILVMLASALINWFISAYLFKVAKQTESIALAADAWHLRTDVYTCAGVMAGLILIKLTGWNTWDSLAALAVGLLIMKAAWHLTSQAMGDVLDTRLPPEEEEKIKTVLKGHPQLYLEYHKLRTRKAGSEKFLDLHMVVPYSWPVVKVHTYCDHLEAEMEKVLPHTQVTIHIEPCTHGAASCELCEECQREKEKAQKLETQEKERLE